MQTEAPEISGKWKQKLKKYFRSLLDIRHDTMGYDELHEMMEENTIIHGSNMWILMLAILIASIGLNVNSAAVIIGAMLISPLMSGILTMGYSLATSDLTMLKKACTRFGTQVAISLITSTIYFLMSPLDVPTSEMIARTSPTIWDVLIALFGGIAGMIGNTRQKKSNVIPGVAIATALMPPLCTAGYGLATLQPAFLFGAFYLFAINTLFIMLSAAFVTKLLRVPHHNELNPKRQKKIHRLITAITIVTIIPSILIGAMTVYDSVMERNISSYLSEEFVFDNTQPVKSDIDKINRVISVSLVGEPVSDEVIDRLRQELPKYGLEKYTLRVTQNTTVTGETDDKVTIAIQEKTINELQSRLEEQQERLDELESSAAAKIDCKSIASDAARIFTKLSGCGCGIMSGADGEYILLSAETDKPLNAGERQTIKNWLAVESGITDARLQITSDSAKS